MIGVLYCYLKGFPYCGDGHIRLFLSHTIKFKNHLTHAPFSNSILIKQPYDYNLVSRIGLPTGRECAGHADVSFPAHRVTIVLSAD